MSVTWHLIIREWLKFVWRNAVKPEEQQVRNVELTSTIGRKPLPPFDLTSTAYELTCSVAFRGIVYVCVSHSRQGMGTVACHRKLCRVGPLTEAWGGQGGGTGGGTH